MVFFFAFLNGQVVLRSKGRFYPLRKVVRVCINKMMCIVFVYKNKAFCYNEKIKMTVGFRSVNTNVILFCTELKLI